MADNNTKELDFDRKHEEDLQRLWGLGLLDDDFMQKVFEDKACTEFLLQIILNRSLINANVTEPGEKYENLCESYVIFITENAINSLVKYQIQSSQEEQF